MKNKSKKKYIISKEDIWKAKKPKYNGFAIGHGPHGDTKYNRRNNKKELLEEIDLTMSDTGN